MYPRIPWHLVAVPLGSAEHTLGTAELKGLLVSYLPSAILKCGHVTLCRVAIGDVLH